MTVGLVAFNFFERVLKISILDSFNDSLTTYTDKTYDRKCIYIHIIIGYTDIEKR